MKPLKMALFLSLMSVSGLLFAQEQMALRLNDKGIMKILKLAVQYNSASKGSQTIVIPGNTYKFTIPKSQLLSNPIVPIVSEISDLSLNKDLDFYFNTSDIKVDGNVDVNSIKTTIFNSHDNGFDIRLSIALPKIQVNGPKLSLCEDKDRYNSSCGSGLKATISNLKIATKGQPVILNAVLRLKTDGKVARVSVRSVESNLESKSSPNLDINFSAITIPRIAIVINGQETELDTSRLKNEILKRKSFLGKKLLAFAGDFIANDVAEMINVYLINQEIATTYQIYRMDNPIRFDEFVFENDNDSNRYNHVARDNTYVHRPNYNLIKLKADNPFDEMMNKISEVIRNAQMDIVLKKISTPGNKDIELAGLLNFVLNHREINVRNSFRNSNRALPKLDLSAHRGHDLNLAISEPLINGALDLANSTNIFQEIFESMSPVPGVSIRSIKVHFAGNKSLIAVVNAKIDLKKLASKNIGTWFKNQIAAVLERNNNNAVIYFPVEVAVIPVFKKLSNGGTGLDLKVLSPFKNMELHNTYNYPSNVPDMTSTVKEGVMEELRESIEPHMNKTYSVDLTSFLNQSGVIFTPKGISINQGAYLLLNLDIADIKYNSKNPNKR